MPSFEKGDGTLLAFANLMPMMLFGHHARCVASRRNH